MSPSPHGPTTPKPLAVYLRRHAAASKGGLDLFRRAASSHRDPRARQVLGELAQEVAEDRAALMRLLAELGVSRPRVGEVLAGWGEVAGRLVPNGTLLARSPLSDLLEIEALRSAVSAKKSGWVSLRDAGSVARVLGDEELTRLVGRADRQLELLDDLRGDAAVAVLAR